MKKTSQLLSFICLALLICIACKKNEDNPSPASHTLAGRYVGKTSYFSANTNINTENTLVRVYQQGSNYYFKFFNGIPLLSNIKMNQLNDSTFQSEESTGLINIKVMGKHLSISANQNGATWNADCTRE